jgi:hypothetical protein
MPVFGSHFTRVRVQTTTIAMGILQRMQMAVFRGSLTRHSPPGSNILMRPLENLQMTLGCRGVTNVK